MKVPSVVLVTAILAAAVLEGIALWRGVNGIYFAGTMTLIGALAGVSADRVWLARKSKKAGEGV